jgi:hypothetical protein
MFPSQPLMSAIHADRMRDIERASRERRMLQAPSMEAACTAPLAIAAPARRADAARGSGRSSDAACGVA